MKVVDLSDHDSCAKLASSIFALIQDVLQLFNRLLTIKSIPVVQQVYQAILADMTSNFNVLLNVLEQKTIVIAVDYGVLKTLYSHCAAHEHLIHNSDLFKQNDTNNTMSLTKDNFEDLLKLLHRLIVNSHLSCHDTKRMYATTWLERLFQSCQRQSNNESSKDEHLSEDQHRLLSYEQLPNFGNDALV
ncbi:unnamed protein product [Rotaria socialis]|uniref:Uncharacterized protein n=1 Tax=Rotaria socialis TaxID=392032 RepID=A0A820GLC8_9BILA|nr:unnamed protein product [Rotaria socialis]CAF4277165.1 unnamed protein product [Rotaria socialis]